MKSFLTYVTVAIAFVAIASCNQGPAPVVGAEFDKKVDSTKQALIKNAEAEIAKKCEERMRTEVMSKADSIVNAAKPEKTED